MKTIIVFLSLFLAAPCFGWWLVSKQVVVASGSYSDILFYWGAEDETAEKAGGDDSATIVTTATLSTAQHAVGLKSLYNDGLSSGTGTFSVSGKDNVDWDTGSVGFSLYPVTYADDTIFFSARCDSSDRVYLIVDGDDVRLFWRGDNGSSIVALNATLPTPNSSWHYIEARWDVDGGINTTDTLELCIDNSCVQSTSSITALACDPVSIIFGNYLSTAGEHYMDQIMLSNDPIDRDLYSIRTETSL